MLTGEAHYRAGREASEPYYAAQREKHPALEDFFSFLDEDVSLKAQTRLCSSRLERIRASKNAFLRSHVLRCRLEADLLQSFLRLNVKKQIEGARSACERLKLRLKNDMASLEAFLMDSILRYFALQRGDLRRTQEQLLADRRGSRAARAQAEFLRDFRLLAKNLEVETKQQVTISLLAPDAVQAQRCCSAVKENFQPPPGSGAEVAVLRVFKVKHALLSAQLQQTAATVQNGQIKGLFCYVPRAALAAFCAFGIGSQHFCGGAPSAMHSLFHLPWFCYATSGEPPSVPTAEREARSHSVDKLTYYFSKQSLALPRAGRGGGCGACRCCVEEGSTAVVVALCRVLVCRMRTIAGEITEEEVAESARLGCDALFSSKDEEYVLLRPDFVLPEFLMSTQVTVPPQGAPEAVRCWLPPSLEGGAATAEGAGGAEAMAKKQALVAGIEDALQSCRQRFPER